MRETIEISIFRRSAALGAGALLFGFGCMSLPGVAFAQDLAGPADSAVSLVQPATFTAEGVSSSLPDAPSPAEANEPEALQTGLAHTRPQPAMAGPYVKYIQPGQSAPKLTAKDKFVLGVRDAVSPLAGVGWVAAATYEQIINGSPNYGQTGTGFAQRLGAAAARASSEGIFSDSILSPVFHEDPRYYKMGRGHNFIKRLAYAGTRPIFTRTDGGHQTINFALLGGNLAGSALTQAYYPPLNRGLTQVMETFGGSIGGSALGFVVSEFLADTLVALHISKPE